jgi:hypothetical protein
MEATKCLKCPLLITRDTSPSRVDLEVFMSSPSDGCPATALCVASTQAMRSRRVSSTMRPALDPAGHRVRRTKPTCLLHTWRPHRRRPFALVLHLHQHQSSCNLHLQYLAKNQSTQRCQSLITQGSDHPLVLEPHMVLNFFIGRMPSDRNLLSLDASLVILTCVLHFEASRRQQLGRSDRPTWAVRPARAI